MLFKNIDRFSPVAIGKDLPHERDLYFQDSDVIPKKVKELESFLTKFPIDKPWWDRQRTRCINGYIVPNAVDFKGGDVFKDGVTMVVNEDGSRYIPSIGYTVNKNGDIWISGRQYFYLNFWKISIENQATGSKDYQHPWFTDLSWENWMLRERARREFKDIFFGKCRQRGLSEEEAGDTGWIWCFMHNVQVGIVAGIDVYNKNTFGMVTRGIDSIYNTQFRKTIGRSSIGEGILTSKYTGVEIHSRTAKDNPQILSGLNKLYKAHVEEIAIMKEGLATEMRSFILPSIKTTGDRRTGFIVYTGTAGRKYDKAMETKNLNNNKDMEEMLYNPDSYDLLSIDNTFDEHPAGKIACFIPTWKFRILDENNNSLKEDSRESYKRALEKELPKNRPLFKSLEPWETKDMFTIASGGFFGDFIIHHCNEARSKIITHQNKVFIERGFLHYKNNAKKYLGVEWELNMDKGDIEIYEHPQTTENFDPITKEKIVTVKEELYLQGTDSYDQSESKTSSSQLASLIFKKVDKSLPMQEAGIINNFVASYLDRPSEEQGGRMTAFANTAKLSLYYGVQNMIEHTKIAIFDYYHNYGLEGYLSPRPDMVLASNIINSEVVNKFGLPPSLILPMLTKLRDWLSIEDNIYKIPFEYILEKFAKFKRDPRYNCDITMAAACIMASYEEYILEMETQKDSMNKPQVRRFRGYQIVNGRLIQVYA